MKANRVFGIWKAIAFLTVIISCMISCSSCEPEIDLNPKVTLLSPESLSSNSVVLVASLTTKEKPLVVRFEYFDGVSWKSEYSSLYGANKTEIVKKEISGLSMGKTYQLRADACSILPMGPGTYAYVTAASSATKEFTTPDPSIITIKEMKSDFTSISVKLELIPKAANTKVQLEYQVNGSAMTKLSEAYSGESAVEINFKLDNLVKNTIYQIKLKTINEFAVTLDTTFKTCAVRDRDGNPYRIIEIGNQIWLQENFRGTHFLNGDPIPNVTDQAQWEAMTTPAYCWYNNDSKIGEVYGGLYNWYVATDPRGLIEGYHVPEQDEWYTLSAYLGGDDAAGGKMKEAGFAHWLEPNSGATNSSGFCALPGGSRLSSFGYLHDTSKFWSNTNFGISNVAYEAYMRSATSLLQLHGGDVYSSGFGIRLVKN